jgi:hypothetical protein
MCDGCSISKNRDAWSQYPDMLDLCKMCHSFQESIYKTIEDQKKIMGSALAKVDSKAKKLAKKRAIS